MNTLVQLVNTNPISAHGKDDFNRILIVDDDHTNRLVLRNLLQKNSYEVIEAQNGSDAIAMYQEYAPDIVLMDVMMPVMDGYESARRIKELAGNHFVPIVFLTALTEEKALGECVDSGGDDFLTKPYSRNILKLKLNAALRVRKLYCQLEQYTNKVEQHNDYMKSEQEAAERIFNKMVNRGHLHEKCFNYRVASAALFNGDLLLASRLQDGTYRVLVGDFTGHGLPAAVGAIPIAEMFYTMNAKSRPLAELAREINRKLKNILPSEVFLSACLIDIRTDAIEVWNAGLPDVLIFDNDNDLRKISSQHLPFGIISDAEFNAVVSKISINQDSRIYIYSDGVIEATNVHDELFGEDRLISILNEKNHDILSKVWSEIGEFTGAAEQHDDMTMIEILPANME